METKLPPLLLEVKNFGPNDSEERELARAFTYLLVPEQKRQITAALAAPIEAISLSTGTFISFFLFFVPQAHLIRGALTHHDLRKLHLKDRR